MARTTIDALAVLIDAHHEDMGRRVDDVKHTVLAQNSRIGKAEDAMVKAVAAIAALEARVSMGRLGPMPDESLDYRIPKKWVGGLLTAGGGIVWITQQLIHVWSGK